MKLSFPADHSIAFTSITMTPLTYLNRLLARITSLGGKIHRAHLPSLDDLSHIAITSLIGQAPSAIIICTGLGSLTLGGVEDKTVYPTRGQVIKVRAPWVRNGFTRQVGSLDGGEGGERTYVIPRPDGEVILGGTREEGDWDPYPREETARDILRRAGEICPELKPAHMSAPELGRAALPNLDVPESSSMDGGLENLVISHLVGFRPSRKHGVRLERGPDLKLDDANVKVVYNYGHGGAGWQCCWGYAESAVELVIHTLPKLAKS
jgi:D-amino-acid oxidase